MKTTRSRLTRSITQSEWKVALHSAATLQTWTTASGSSAFTWKMGAFTTRATSVQYGDDRENLGSVVNPIWLFTTMWTVPGKEKQFYFESFTMIHILMVDVQSGISSPDFDCKTRRLIDIQPTKEDLWQASYKRGAMSSFPSQAKIVMTCQCLFSWWTRLLKIWSGICTFVLVKP